MKGSFLGDLRTDPGREVGAVDGGWVGVARKLVTLTNQLCVVSDPRTLGPTAGPDNKYRPTKLRSEGWGDSEPRESMFYSE